MTPDTPGVMAAEGAAYVVPTGSNVAGMREVVPGMAGARRAARRRRGASAGPRTRATCRAASAERAVRANRARSGRSTCSSRSSPARPGPRSPPSGDRVPPPPPVADLAARSPRARHRGRLRPAGQPRPAADASAPTVAPLPDRRRGHARRGPLRVGARRASTRPPRTPTRTGSCRSTRRGALERRGAVSARLHDVFYTTTGNDTPVATSATFGQEIAAELRRRGSRPCSSPGPEGRARVAGQRWRRRFERAGIPTVFVTALPTIATMVAPTASCAGVAITHPHRRSRRSAPADERAAAATAIVERALEMLETEVEPTHGLGASA